MAACTRSGAGCATEAARGQRGGHRLPGAGPVPLHRGGPNVRSAARGAGPELPCRQRGRLAGAMAPHPAPSAGAGRIHHRLGQPPGPGPGSAGPQHPLAAADFSAAVCPGVHRRRGDCCMVVSAHLEAPPGRCTRPGANAFPGQGAGGVVVLRGVLVWHRFPHGRLVLVGRQRALVGQGLHERLCGDRRGLGRCRLAEQPQGLALPGGWYDGPAIAAHGGAIGRNHAGAACAGCAASWG